MSAYSYAWIVPTEMPIGGGAIMSIPGGGMSYFPTDMAVSSYVPQTLAPATATYVPYSSGYANSNYPISSGVYNGDMSSYIVGNPTATFMTVPTSGPGSGSGSGSGGSGSGSGSGSGQGGSGSGSDGQGDSDSRPSSGSGSGSGSSGQDGSDSQQQQQQQQQSGKNQNLGNAAPALGRGVAKSGLLVALVALTAIVL